MKKAMKKIVALGSGAALLVSASVMGTMAYLTSQDEVVNTFTVGDVEIILDEAKVDTAGEWTDGHDTRVEANSYKLMPGHTYKKDPTVTVKAGSEDAYIRMLVTVDSIDKVKEAFPAEEYIDFYNGETFLLQQLVDGWDNTKWIPKSVEGNVYEFRYFEPVDATEATEDIVLDDLFETITIPGTVDNEALAKLNDVKISVVAHAIQVDTFANEDAAWAAFDGQHQN